jgi:DNA-directed RNA polymerase specialized sigma24 family protein
MKTYQNNATVHDLTLSGEDDETLAGAVKQNPAAFDELYRRHLNRVYRYLLSQVGHIHDAQDLTAQTFIAALEGLTGRRVGYQPAGKFSLWLLGIARRKAADHFRRRGAAPSRSFTRRRPGRPDVAGTGGPPLAHLSA